MRVSDKESITATPTPVSSVLLANLHCSGAHHDLTVDELYTFFQRKPLRIVIFEKNGEKKAVLEFPDSTAAAAAKQTAGDVLLGQAWYHISLVQSHMQTPLQFSREGDHARDYTAYTTPALTPPPSTPAGTPVIMVTNLPAMGGSCKGLFNLFSSAGDVMKVKILNKNNCSALLEYRTPEQAAKATAVLNGVPLFGNSLRVVGSTNQKILMKEGEVSAFNEDFSNSALHRFEKENSKNFQNVFLPSRFIHICGIAPHVQDGLVEAALRHCCSCTFRSFKTTATGKMGIATAESTGDAVTLLFHLHGHSVGYGGTAMRLSFADTRMNRDGPSVDDRPTSTSVLLVNIGEECLDMSQTQRCLDVLYHFFSRVAIPLRAVIFEKDMLSKALVEFSSPADAERAKELDRTVLPSGQTLTMGYSSVQPPLTIESQRGRCYSGVVEGADLMLGGGGGGVVVTPVVLLSNLPEEMVSCVGLFNLFSTVGDVMRIKIMHQKRSTALVEYRTVQQAVLCRQALNGVMVVSRRVRVTPSVKETITPPAQGDELNYDFTHSPLHRFRVQNSRNSVNAANVQPSHVLHISNIPAIISDAEVTDFVSQCAPGVFTSFNKTVGVGDKKMGTAVMEGVEQAVRVLMTLHGTECEGYPGTSLRISFAKR